MISNNATSRLSFLKLVSGTGTITAQAAAARAPKLVTLAQLHKIMPDLPKGTAKAYLPFLNKAMAEAHINTPQRKAMFLAQIAHESDQLRAMEERGSTDRYKGRGAIQLTGIANYRAAGKALHVNLVDHPELAATKKYAFRVTGWFWSANHLNSFCDRGDFLGLTRAINGGLNGLESRQHFYAVAKRVFGVR